MPIPCSAEIGEYFANPPAGGYSAVCSSIFSVSILLTASNRGLPTAHQQARKVIVGSSQGSSPIDHHHDGVGLIECHPGLAKDFRGNQLGFVREGYHGIHHPGMLARPLDLAVNPVTGDARLIAHDQAWSAGGRRLKSVDLPTLGRPTMARTGHEEVSTTTSRRITGGRACGSGSSTSMRPIGPWLCTGRLRIFPKRAAALASAAAFAAAPRLTSARECWPPRRQAWPGGQLSPLPRAFHPGNAAWAFWLWFLLPASWSLLVFHTTAIRPV